MSDEMIDEVDPASGAVIGQAARSVIHDQARWHQVFHCLVMSPERRTVVLQQRSLDKAAFPGKLDLSATGHLAAGESPLDGLRELHEELGVDDVAADALLAVGTRLLADDQGEARNRELVHLYFCADDRPLDRYRPDPAEVGALLEIDVDDLVAVIDDPDLRRPAAGWSGETGFVERTVDRSQLVADAGQYWTVVAVMAQRFLDGVRPLAI
ncbi:MAG: NUDIX domain-containing protein [Actinomycetota bacterium]